MTDEEAETKTPAKKTTASKRQRARDPETTNEAPVGEVHEESPEASEKRDEAEQADQGAEPETNMVLLDELKINTKGSDSVRVLQRVLNARVTGDFDRATQSALRYWQHKNGFVGGRGYQVNRQQAERLFGDGFELV